jgi:hypothetical protein
LATGFLIRFWVISCRTFVASCGGAAWHALLWLTLFDEIEHGTLVVDEMHGLCEVDLGLLCLLWRHIWQPDIAGGGAATSGSWWLVVTQGCVVRKLLASA